MADTNTSSAASGSKSKKVPEGHRRILWAYCADDTSKNGTVEDVPEADAAALVEGKRARYVDDSTPLGKADRPTRPTRTFGGGNAPADTSSAGETGSATR